eukprot:TRINITY_DN2995_c0_g1_i7.p1 TRINITY_DN2995_c0_g1~~TRINITY_DN2995_c0_g1_i7.p1  ORF type:complete len:142 (-),score=10.10 TRINITY_DN2995_c0_g1_i7:238-663(-)
MNREMMKHWINNIFSKRKNSIWRPPSLLILDQFSAHKDWDIVKLLEKYNVHCLFIPAGLTLILQPLDKGVNKPFKTGIKQQWGYWISTRKLNAKGLASIFQISRWVANSWEKISPEIISNSFTSCVLERTRNRHCEKKQTL